MEKKIEERLGFFIYPKDELADKRQKILTLEEKGVWSVIRWMCCDSEQMGYLTTGTYKHKNLKKIFTGYPEEKTEEWLKTFLMLGLLAKNENGELYSPEIIESYHRRRIIYEMKSKAGKKGGISKAKAKQKASRSVADIKQNASKPLAEVKQKPSKTLAKGKQTSSRTLAEVKQNSSRHEQSTETLKDTNQEKSDFETLKNDAVALSSEDTEENAETASNNNNKININKNINNKIFINNACAREGEIEPPLGMPKSEEEAVAMAEAAGVPESFTREKAYPRILSVGYMEGKTQIRNFGQWAKLYYGNWINNQKRNQKENKPEKKIKSYMFDDKPLPRL